MAAVLEVLGERKEALQTFTRLVKQYPTSPWVPDAYFAIGEYYFDNNDAEMALQAYKTATEFDDAGIYVFALHRLGWCYFNVGERDAAVDCVAEVLALTGQAIESGEAPIGIRRLHLDAMRDEYRWRAE